MTVKFTDKLVKKYIKEAKPGYHGDGNGLFLRISKERTGFWVVRYTIHGKRREISIGSYPNISLADSRLQALQTKSDVKQGIDPQAEKKRGDKHNINTVADLAQDWLAELEKRLKHPNIPRRVYTKEIAPVIGKLAIDQVNPIDIREIIQRISTSNRPTIANDCLMYCKQLFRHSIKLGLRTYNPAEAFNVNDAGGVEKSRSRALSLNEIKQAFACFREHNNQFTRENYLAVSLLLTLAVRKGELIAAEWTEFDLDKALWEIPEGRSKTGRPITVPLPKQAIEWLKELKTRAYNSEYVFPNRRASKRFGHISPDTVNAAIQKLFREKKMPIEHFTVHDLRRTCRSLMSNLGVPGHVAERCLNHKLKGVEGIYDRYDYLDERREALNKIAELTQPIILPKEA